MILGVDVGGTKTLLGLFSGHGELKKTHKSLTHNDYHTFVQSLARDITTFTNDDKLDAISIAMPGPINRKQGKVISLGHRPWKNVSIVNDLKNALNYGGKIYLENDAKLAGLAEAQLYKDQPVVVYVTISTGLGTAILLNGKIDPRFQDIEGGFMLIQFEGQLQYWDYVASGKAFAARYGKLAKDVDDPKIWADYMKVLAPGFSAIHALLNPDVIVVGGGLGMQLAKFHDLLMPYLSQPDNPNRKVPKIVTAKYDGNSVLHGCYTLAKHHETA